MPTLNELEKENKELREMLKELEWINFRLYKLGTRPLRCPICMCSQIEKGGDGHDQDCRLAKLLEGRDGLS